MDDIDDIFDEKKNWFRKHWVISIFLGIFVIGLIGMISDSADSGVTGNVVDEQESVEIQGNLGSGSENIINKERKEVNKISKEYIKRTYDDTCAIFNSDSKHTSIQKEKIFEEEYEEKYANWTGNVENIDISILSNLRLKLDMPCGTGKVYMNQNQYDKLILLSKDDSVTFSGRFDAEPTSKIFGGIHFVLKDGELLNVQKEEIEKKESEIEEAPDVGVDIDADSFLDDINEALEDLKEQQGIYEKLDECTELCAGEDIDIPVIKSECSLSCTQIYYYTGEESLDEYIEELRV